jgi:hypothetical protein
MGTSIFPELDYTRFNSDIRLCDSLLSLGSQIYLSSKDTGTSYFNNDLVHFYKAITVDGILTNTELNNNTTNITSISGLVSSISGNINSISGLVNTHTTNIRTISGNVYTLSGQISSNNNLSNVITVTSNSGVYTINIGNAV